MANGPRSERSRDAPANKSGDSPPRKLAKMNEGSIASGAPAVSAFCMSDEEKDTTPPELKPPPPNWVVFVERDRRCRKFSDIEVRAEMEKFFPEVRCRAFMQKDTTIRVESFACATDLQRLSSKASWMSFGEKGVPFGDITDVHKKQLPSKDEIRWSVAMVTDVVLTQNTMERRLTSASFNTEKVIPLKTKVGPDRQLWRIVAMSSEKDFKRIVCEGVELGYLSEKAMPRVLWKKASTRCFKCQKRAQHESGECTANHSVCPRCSGNHGLKECKSVTLERPSCKRSHPVWAFSCPEFSRNVRKEAKRLALPYPSRWSGVSMESLHPIDPSQARYVQKDHCFAKAAGGRKVNVRLVDPRWRLF